MKKTKRIILIFSVFLFLPVLFSACGRQPEGGRSSVTFQYASYRDVPGVTQDDIKAIEALRGQVDYFTYGMMSTTEAFYNENNEIRGFAALFCEWLTGFFGIPFKPEIIDWEPLLAGLASFDVDFTGAMTATEERRKDYFFTTAIAMHTIQYFRIEDSLPLELIAELRPLRYGFMEGTTTIEQVTSKLKPGTFEVLLARDIETAYRMLKSGEVDAVFNENLVVSSFDIYGDVIARDFFPLIYSPVSLATQNPALEPVISVMQKALDNGALRYLVELYNTGYREYLRQRLYMRLNEEERLYIQNHSVIPFAAETGNYPVSFYNTRERQWQGIAFEVLREVQSLTGLRFERANNENDDWPVILKMLEDDRVSMITELMYSDERARNFLWTDTAILADNFALISRLNFRNVSLNEILYIKVGLIKGYGTTDLFWEWFPDHSNTVEYENTLAAFDALGRGEVDVVMTTNHELLILTHYLERTGFKSNFIFDVPFNSTFGFNGKEAVLCSIVGKALKMIDTKSIADQWMRRTYDYRRIVLEAQFPWLIGSSVLFLCVLALVAVFFARSRRAGKRLEKLVEERTHDLELQTSMLATIIDSSPDFIFCKDTDFRYTQCNKSMRDFMDVHQEDIIGKNVMDVFAFSPQEAEMYISVDKNVIRTRKPVVYEGDIVSQSGGGKRLLTETIKVPLLQDGVLIGVMGISRDITKRKETENALALQTAKLQAILDSIPDLVLCKDLNLVYTLCNKAAEEVNGRTEAETIGKTDVDAWGFPPDVAEKVIAEDRIVLREGRKTVIEELIPFSDGSWRILETIRTPLVQDGVMIGLLVIARNITERKKVERELELQTATLTTLFDSIPDLIFTMDTSLRFTQCNRSFTEHFGLGKEDIINKGEEATGLSAELAQEHNDWNRKVIEERQTVVREERVPRFDGITPVYETVKMPLMLNGAVAGLLCIGHNITQRKEMEEAALAASNSKSAFLANMSHEIRTPMNSIMGFSELALDGEVSEKTRDYLGKIQTNAEWLLQIINDILDISKIESGKMELENIPFDIHELFESCRTLITPKAVEKGITLLFYAEPSVGKMPLGDPTRLRQVLVNLLSNAVKFTNSGTVKVLTEIKEREEKTTKIHFEIKDSGIGMTSEQIERIFDPFTQAETGTTRKYGGTGLGLTISRNFIELMGGTLAVESTPGVGSKFSFDLTFDTVDIDDNETFKHKVVLNELEKPIFDGEVLLCEDNAMNQQVICEHLARVGIKTVVAENGKVGVEKVESRKRKDEKQFDLIFMDIHMPIMDGLEAAQRIIELDTGVPIVAMTANIMSNDMEIYKASGMHDCIGKPFTSQELWRCLLKYLTLVSRGSKDINTHQKNTQTEEELKFQRELDLLFARSNQGKYEEIEKALADGDISLANRLAHSLKANAGHIKKIHLQQAAGEVEQMLKDGENLVTAGQMKKLETELKKVLEELQPLLEEAQAEEKEVSALEPEKVKELFEKLEPLLNKNSLDSLNYINDLRAVAESEHLIQQIEDFDFEPAVAALAELKKKLEIEATDS